MCSIQERTAALQGNLPVGFGTNATATPSVPSNGPTKLGEVDTSTSVVGFKPEYGASDHPAPPAQGAPQGSVLAAGWLKKTGKGLKAKVFEQCWVSLLDEPALQFHSDEKKQAQKGAALPLAGGNVRRVEDVVVVHTPVEAVVGSGSRVNELKLQAETPVEADQWVLRIEAAMAGEPQPT